MKMVMLVDGSKSNFEKMIDVVDSSRSVFLDTQNCDESHEYTILKQNIDYFSQSNNEIMLAKFSGRKSIVKDIGDESPEMIVSLSYNKESEYYSDDPIKTFEEFINILRLGD